MAQCFICKQEIGRGGIVQEDGTSLCFACDAETARVQKANVLAMDHIQRIAVGFFSLCAASFGGWLLAAGVHHFYPGFDKNIAYAFLFSPMAIVYLAAIVFRIQSKMAGFALGVLVAGVVCLPFMAFVIMKLGDSAGL
jgi:hypothetical protein